LEYRAATRVKDHSLFAPELRERRKLNWDVTGGAVEGVATPPYSQRLGAYTTKPSLILLYGNMKSGNDQAMISFRSCNAALK
jgi:hypothetical protein